MGIIIELFLIGKLILNIIIALKKIQPYQRSILVETERVKHIFKNYFISPAQWSYSHFKYSKLKK